MREEAVKEVKGKEENERWESRRESETSWKISKDEEAEDLFGRRETVESGREIEE